MKNMISVIDTTQRALMPLLIMRIRDRDRNLSVTSSAIRSLDRKHDLGPNHPGQGLSREDRETLLD